MPGSGGAVQLSLQQFWIGLAAIVVIVVQVNSVLSMQHRIEHAGDFPAASYVDIDLVSHDHDHEQAGHDDGAADPSASPTGDSEDQPLRHHHHGGGGEAQLALAPAVHAVSVMPSVSALVAPGLDRAPPGVDLDHPFDPPRPTRLIA
jgi:hypothetical protein